MLLRPARAADLEAVTAIYNAGIAERIATFETRPRESAELAGWFDDGEPFVVAERDGTVVGWARAGAYSDRCVYEGIGEHAVYVHPEARGEGLGGRLLDALCEVSERRGIYKLTSRIFSDNAASLAAHRAAGFEVVGVQRRHGRLDGVWKDCVVVERLLGDATRASPETVAVITDIHGNLPALEAALARIDALGIERVYCGGDLVGYGPHPNEVCALIAERGIPTIYGNYDYAIARDLDDCGCAYVTPHDRELGQQSVAWTLEHTGPAAKEFMRALPFDLHFTIGERRVHLVHGSPRKVNEYLFEDKPARLYERLAAAESDDVLVFGHTHKPWIHTYGDVRFVNCGSVGKPKDGDPRGAFAVLDAAGGSLEVTIERVSYDAAAVADEVRAAGLPPEYADKLLVAA